LRLQADPEGWKEQNPDAPDPFVLMRLPEDEPVKLVGRGSTDDKGPVTGWLNVLQAHKELDIDLLVNIRFLFEGMEEQASTGLEAWIKEEVKKSDGFFAGIDCICIVSI
jgi:Cys-Gly metallodipeptidase DUG1